MIELIESFKYTILKLYLYMLLKKDVCLLKNIYKL